MTTQRNPGKSVLGFAGFVLIVGGASGLSHEWFGWIRVFGFLRLVVPHGYEVYGYVLLVVLGIALAGVSEIVSRGGR